MTVPPPAAPPPAFRLKRPYASEDEFAEGDGHALSKGGMVLVGAGPRPSGLIVRFEVALRDGVALFRGEGKVVQHRLVADAGGPAGLEIRFTRLDARGKSIVDRVLRARAEALSPSPPPAIPDLTPPPERVVVIPEAIPSPVEPIPSPVEPIVAPPSGEQESPPEAPTTPTQPAFAAEEVTRRVDMPPSDGPGSVAPAGAASPASPPVVDGDREGMLARLRGARRAVQPPDPSARAALLERLRAR